MMRYLLHVLVSGLVLAGAGCGRTPPAVPVDDETAKKNMRDQAQQLIDASLANDFDRAAGLTHPQLVKMMGGREKYVRSVQDAIAGLRSDGGEIQKLVIGDALAVTQVNGEFFGIVPHSLYMTMNKKVFLQPSFFVAHSPDGGRAWTFLDGAGLKDDRAKVKQIIPNFPDTLALPKRPDPLLLWE